MKRLLCLAVCLFLAVPHAALARKAPRGRAKKPAAASAKAAKPSAAAEAEATGEEEPPEPAAGAARADETDVPEPEVSEAPDDEARAPGRPAVRPAEPPTAEPNASAAEEKPAGPPKAVWPSERGYRWLEKVAGPQALKLLADRGYLVTYQLGDARHLVHVQWDLLEPLVRRAPALLEAQALINGFRHGRVPDGKEEALRSVLELPPIGLSTPRIRSAASVLLDLLAERQVAGQMPLPRRPFASLPWARDFVHRYAVTDVHDVSTLVDPFFLELLCAPRHSAAAQADVKAAAQARYATDIGQVLERDVKAGQLSDELRGWVVKYLDDARHALRLSELPADFAALFQTNQLQSELSELRLAADALSKDPAFLDVLRNALAPGVEPAQAVRLTLTPLHLHSGDRGDAPDPGDRAMLSAAYWLDGLPRGGSTVVEELAFADRGADGIELLFDRQRTLGPGGPYTLAAEAPVRDNRPFAVRLILHAAGAKPAHRDENIAASSALEQLLASLGKADSAFAACRFGEACSAYQAIAREPGGRAGRAAFERLAADLKSRQRRCETASWDLDQAQSLLAGVRADASAKDCAFATQRGEKARGLLRRLPAGCSRDLAPEVNLLVAAASQRLRDQETFWSSVETGRKLEQNCQHERAARTFAAGLAVLDADAAARCGAAEQEYRKVKELDLPSALAGDAIRASFERQVEGAAQALDKGDPAGALAALNPVLARIGAQTAVACYEPQRRRAEELVNRATAALGATPAAGGKAADAVDAAVDTVTREVARRRAAEEAKRHREQAQQAPLALDELPGVPAPAVKKDLLAPAGSAGGQFQRMQEAARASQQATAEAQAAVDGVPEGAAAQPADEESLAPKEPERKTPAKKKTTRKSKGGKRRKS